MDGIWGKLGIVAVGVAIITAMASSFVPSVGSSKSGPSSKEALIASANAPGASKVRIRAAAQAAAQSDTVTVAGPPADVSYIPQTSAPSPVVSQPYTANDPDEDAPAPVASYTGTAPKPSIVFAEPKPKPDPAGNDD
jgi:hypothetical protein